MPNKVIILACPVVEDSLFINFEEEIFKKAGEKVTVIGDNVRPLTQADMDTLLTTIASSSDRILLFIETHGGFDSNNNHVIQINDTSDGLMKVQDLFDKIKKIEKPIDIISTACHGGAAHEFAQNSLPWGSSYVSLASATEGVYEEDVIKMMIEFNHQGRTDGMVTAEQLLSLYLTRALTKKLSPSISTKDSSELLSEKLKHHLGRDFSDSEKECVYKELESLVPKTRLDSLISKIESYFEDLEEDSLKQFPVQDYGLALAICHAASGEMNSSMLLEKQKIKNNLQKIAENFSKPNFPEGIGLPRSAAEVHLQGLALVQKKHQGSQESVKNSSNSLSYPTGVITPLIAVQAHLQGLEVTPNASAVLHQSFLSRIVGFFSVNHQRETPNPNLRCEQDESTSSSDESTSSSNERPSYSMSYEDAQKTSEQLPFFSQIAANQLKNVQQQTEQNDTKEQNDFALYHNSGAY